MDIAIDMRCRNVLGKNIIVYKIICPFRTVFQHGSHGSIRVNICILSLNICICRTGKSQFLINIDQICFRLTNLRMLCAIQNIGLCSLCKAMGDQPFFHKILYLLYIRYLIVRNQLHHLFYQLFKLIGRDCFHLGCIVRLSDRCSYLHHIKRYRSSISFLDNLRAYDVVLFHFIPSINHIWYSGKNACTI